MEIFSRLGTRTRTHIIIVGQLQGTLSISPQCNPKSGIICFDSFSCTARKFTGAQEEPRFSLQLMMIMVIMMMMMMK